MMKASKDIYALRKSLAEQLTAVDTVIALLEGGVAPSSERTEQVAENQEIDKEKEKAEILGFTEHYFKQNGNKSTTVRELTKLILDAGIKVSGKQAGTTVGAYLLRSGKYRNDDGKWSMI